jgi:hypothetical protein
VHLIGLLDIVSTRPRLAVLPILRCRCNSEYLCFVVETVCWLDTECKLHTLLQEFCTCWQDMVCKQY